MYAAGEYDLAGFAVGVVERAKILDGTRRGPATRSSASRRAGCTRTATRSRGACFEGEMQLGDDDRGRARRDGRRGAARADAASTRRRCSALLDAAASAVHGIAHITGGGLGGNLPRVLPDGLGARLDSGRTRGRRSSTSIATGGPVDEDEMRRTFNLGVGLRVRGRAKDGAPGGRRMRSRRRASAAWRCGEVIEVGATVAVRGRGVRESGGG